MRRTRMRTRDPNTPTAHLTLPRSLMPRAMHDDKTLFFLNVCTWSN
jgi:hypothetical protein